MQIGFEKLQERFRNPGSNLWVPRLCKKRIMGYAESIMELSRELNIPETIKGSDRAGILEEKHFAENRELLSGSLNAIAGLMGQMAEEITSCKPMEERKRRRITSALKDEGIRVRDIYYLPGKTGRTVIGLEMSACTQEGIPVQTVADYLSVLLEKDFEPGAENCGYVDKTERTCIFTEKTPYYVLTGYSRITKNSEKISGDNYSIFDSDDGRTNILISDGTGSGEEAFQGSRKVIELLEKMLETGYSRDMAVKMVNMAFCAMERENNHPTLDLCSIDLYDGNCEILKSGAAATFIKRGMEVEILSGRSLPLGMSHSAAAAKTERELKEGEIVLMMTDGVLDALDGHDYEETMQRIISTVTEQNPEGIAQRVLQTVLCLDGGRILDDMTVLAAGFWRT